MKQKGQIQIVFIIVAVLAVIGMVFGFQFFGGGKEKEEKIKLGSEEIVESPGDEGPPVRTELSPSGVLPAGTSKTELSLTTNEPGYCRYSEKPGQSYDQMSNRFSYNNEKTLHIAKVSGLKDGLAYQYYIRCRDLAGNKNIDDTVIKFSVGGTATTGGEGYAPPRPSEAPPVISDLKPTGTLPASTTKTQLSLFTDESAYCRYSSKPGQSYDVMTDRFSYDQEKLSHTASISGLQDNRIYEFYVRCRDLAGNKNDEDVVIRFGVGGVGLPPAPGELGGDTLPPYRYAPSPTKDLPTETRKTTISLKTDEKAFCKYDADSGISYESMSHLFTETGGTSHSTLVTGLSEGKEHKYYVKCIDLNNNKNTNDFIISVKVKAPEDKTPPALRHPSHVGDVLPAGTTEVVISISTNEPADCRYATEQGTLYKLMKGRFSHYDQTKLFHVATIKNLESGKIYDFFVRCQDLAGNANTGDVMIWFSVTP